MSMVIKAFIFDLDGCIYFGEQPAAGAADFIKLIENRDMNYCIISNNSSDSGAEIYNKLSKMGIHTKMKLITPLLYSGEFLTRFIGKHKTVYVLGSDALSRAVKHGGHICSDKAPDVVLLGRDEEFNYRKLTQAANYIDNGAKFVITNSDSSHPAQSVKMPETGALAASIQKMCDVKPLIIGKPEPFLFNIALASLQVKASEVLMVGDTPDTDIAGGNAAGMQTALIRDDVASYDAKKVSLTAYNFYDLNSTLFGL